MTSPVKYSISIVHPETGASIRAEVSYYPVFHGSFDCPPEDAEMDAVLFDSDGNAIPTKVYEDDAVLWDYIERIVGERYSLEESDRFPVSMR